VYEAIYIDVNLLLTGARALTRARFILVRNERLKAGRARFGWQKENRAISEVVNEIIVEGLLE